MATLDTSLISILDASQMMLLPVAADGSAHALTTSQRFGAFVPGDPITVASDAPFHMVAGGSSVAATTSSPKFPAGIHGFTLPDGCTHVAMIQSSAGAAVGQAYRG